MMNSRVGVLGSGIVGRVLANGLIKHGYEVMIGSGNPGNLSDWKNAAGGHASVGRFAEAARFGELVVLAVKGSAAEFVLDLAGIENLYGKTVIDTCNPISAEPPDHGVLRYFTPQNHSLMEQLQNKFGSVRLVKAFNSVGNAVMVDPAFREGKPTMFICGNSHEAKAEVTGILHRFGWEVADMGGVEAARPIEMLAMLWCIPGFVHHQWTHAFKLLR